MQLDCMFVLYILLDCDVEGKVIQERLVLELVVRAKVRQSVFLILLIYCWS